MADLRPLVLMAGGVRELSDADRVLDHIKSAEVHSVSVVTQAVYEALETPDPNTLYIISDSSPSFYLLRQIRVTANISLNDANVWCRVKTGSGAREITLPTTGGLVDGDLVQVTDADGNAAINNITINRNGATIAGIAANFIIDTNIIGPISFVYDGSGNWELG